MPYRSSKANRVAIVGASSLRGKELNQVLQDRHFPADDIVLLDESLRAGTLTEAAGEATFIRGLSDDSFEGIRIAFFAGAPADALRNLANAQRSGTTVIDLTGALAAAGRATAWITSLTAVMPPKAVTGTNGSALPSAYFSPPVAVIVACTLAAGLAAFKPVRTALTMFPPVSERDHAGVEELEQQTTNLLSFRPAQQAIFDAQVAFNLLSEYGRESKPTLAQTRAEIVREVASYLGGRAAMPAIQLVQAPVFYGYAFSAFVEFAVAPDTSAMQAALGPLGVRFAEAEDAQPTNVSVASESEIQMAPMMPDAEAGKGVWLWGVTDNLRLTATNAVRIAEELVASTAN